MNASTGKSAKISLLAWTASFAALIFVLFQAPAVAQQGTAGGGASKPQAGSDVQARVGRLEQQITDLQVAVGTLESLLKSKPGATLSQEPPQPAARTSGPADESELGSRVSALETQIGALTGQIEQMTQQLAALQARLSGGEAPPPPPGAAGRQGFVPPPDAESASAPVPADGNATAPASFGTTSVSRGDADASSGQDAGPEPLLPPGHDADQGAGAPDQPRKLTETNPSGVNADDLYEAGYGDLLQQNYAGAETAFKQLVASFPSDPLAAKAQYWLGETYYVRGQYKDAADAFLKGYKTYRTSDKAPDSLLKLGMSLAELGQKDAACATFDELGTRFPSAPDQIRDEAKNERRKAGC